MSNKTKQSIENRMGIINTLQNATTIRKQIPHIFKTQKQATGKERANEKNAITQKATKKQPHSNHIATGYNTSAMEGHNYIPYSAFIWR